MIKRIRFEYDKKKRQDSIISERAKDFLKNSERIFKQEKTKETRVRLRV